MRGKEREVKKVKKPSKVKRLIIAERDTKDRTAEIEALRLKLVMITHSHT